MALSSSHYRDSQGLIRYDANTFRPLRTNIIDGYEVNMRYGASQATYPRVSHPRTSLPYFSQSNVQPLDNGYGAGGVPSPDYGPKPEGIRPASIIGSVAFWHHRLSFNQAIGVHRFSLLIQKYPALIISILSCFTLFGRGSTSNSGATADTSPIHGEVNTMIAALATGTATVVVAALGSQNHNWKEGKAYSQTGWRMLGAVLTGAGAVATMVLGVLAALELKKQKEHLSTVSLSCFPEDCLSFNERVSNLGIVICLNAGIAILSLLSFMFGTSALVQIEADRKEVKNDKKGKKKAMAYVNPVATVTDEYQRRY